MLISSLFWLLAEQSLLETADHGENPGMFSSKTLISPLMIFNIQIVRCVFRTSIGKDPARNSVSHLEEKRGIIGPEKSILLCASISNKHQVL